MRRLQPEYSRALLPWIFAFALFFAAAVALSGCKSTDQLVAEVEAELWIPERIPASVCRENSRLANYGLYRVLPCNDEARARGACSGEDTYEEFIPYCSKQAVLREFGAMRSADRKRWIERLRQQCPGG